MEHNINHIEKLLRMLPEFGWGDSIKFTNSIDEFNKALEILKSEVSMTIIYSRASYLRNNGKLDYSKWVETVFLKKDNYASWMIKQFNFISGEIIIPKETDINYLAGKFLEYRNNSK